MSKEKRGHDLRGAQSDREQQQQQQQQRQQVVREPIEANPKSSLTGFLGNSAAESAFLSRRRFGSPTQVGFIERSQRDGSQVGRLACERSDGTRTEPGSKAGWPSAVEKVCRLCEINTLRVCTVVRRPSPVSWRLTSGRGRLGSGGHAKTETDRYADPDCVCRFAPSDVPSVRLCHQLAGQLKQAGQALPALILSSL